MKNRHTKTGAARIILRILFVAALAVFLWSAWHLFREWKRYHDGEEEYNTLASSARIERISTDSSASSAVQTPDEASSSSESEASETSAGNIPASVPAQPEYYIDFAYLKSINSEVVGWISIPNTRVDYPIVQTDDNEWYLRYSFNGAEEWIGCPFVDYRVSGDFHAQITPVYGHDLNNGAMFPDLKKYREESFCEENPYFYIFTPDRTLIYQVYCALTAEKTDGRAFLFSFTDEADFDRYLDYVNSVAYYTTDAVPDFSDRLVSLITCETDRNYRFIVNGVLIEEIAESH